MSTLNRSEKWVFTINNWTEEHKAYLRNVKCRYIVWGEEVAPSTGTPHLQGVVFFASKKSHSQTVASLPDGTWTEASKCVDESIIYAKKEGKYEEVGVEPMSRKRKGQCNIDRYQGAWEAAKKGRFDDIPEDIRIRHYSTLKKIHADYVECPPWVPHENYWFHGPSGCGKSKLARERYPEAYIKDPMSRWWDGYNGESHVIVDDFDKYQVAQSGDVKRWCDHYPFMAPVKGGYIKIRPAVVVVTSNYSPEEIWQDEQTLNPVRRRFKIVDMDPAPSGYASIFKV